MTCTVDDQFIESVCKTWNSSGYCNILANKKPVSLENFEKQIFNDNKTKDSDIIFATDVTSTVLKFKAELQPHQVKQVNIFD